MWDLRLPWRADCEYLLGSGYKNVITTAVFFTEVFYSTALVISVSNRWQETHQFKWSHLAPVLLGAANVPRVPWCWLCYVISIELVRSFLRPFPCQTVKAHYLYKKSIFSENLSKTQFFSFF